jgi:broad specificity phosphatase PhoE
MNIYLIRHSQSEGNVCKQKYYEKNDCDIELTEIGEHQSKRLGYDLHMEIGGHKSTYLFSRFWKKNLAISSSFNRALKTRDIATSVLRSLDHTIDLDTSPLLIERQWGGLREIVDDKTLDREQHFNFYYQPVGGESFLDCYQRVVLFFQDLRTNPKYRGYDNIMIFTHGEWIRLALMYLDGTSVEDFTKYRKNPKNCEVIKRVLKN